MNIIKLEFPESQTRNWVPLNLLKVFFIVLHHSGGKISDPGSINQAHLNNGWPGGFGYNDYIRKDGTVYIGRGDHIGAQCQNFNSKSYGICCEGDYNIETSMPEAQFNSLVERIRYNRNRFPNIIYTAPHSQLVPTECPGKKFPFDKALIYSECDFKKIVIKLQSKGIISSPDYWLQNCQEGKKVSGKYINAVILNFVAMFKIVNTFAEAVDVLRSLGVVVSPDYWLKCVDGFEVEGWYARKLLESMAGKL